jgi:hypothetical protein
MSSYYDDEDELDIRIHRHGGRASPQPVIYRERPRTVAQPVYYSHGPSYLNPEHSVMRRSSSTHRHEERRSPQPLPTPVIINNYNDYEDDRREEHYLQLARPVRSRSRSRPSSFASSTAADYELEKTRKELEAYKLEAAREKEKERMKAEMEFKRLRDEKKRKEEEERAKKEADEAVAKYQVEQEKKAAKEKKEKEEREKEYKERMEADMRKAGMDENQIAVVLKKEGAIERPTYTRMSRRHLSIETLNVHRIEYTFDQVRAKPEPRDLVRGTNKIAGSGLHTH